MKRGITGTGSASMLLIFTVLCMALFSLISLSSARTESAMTKSWQASVEAYYRADLLSERVLAVVLDADEQLPSAYGIELNYYTQKETGEYMVSYHCVVDENRLLCVSASLHGGGGCTIREWRLVNTNARETGEAIKLWPGE